jgi:hypothetical protein
MKSFGVDPPFERDLIAEPHFSMADTYRCQFLNGRYLVWIVSAARRSVGRSRGNADNMDGIAGRVTRGLKCRREDDQV